MIYHTSMQIAGRDLSFSFDLDENYPCDYGIIDHLRNNVPCESEVCHVMARTLHEGDCAVDGGANVGFFTILMSKLVGETGKVYAFEPGGNNLPRLARNIALNECHNVEVIDKPLTELPGRASIMFEHEDGGYNSLWPDVSKEVTIKRAVLSTTLERELLGCVAPTLIKLDIEGAELSALKASGTLLNWQKPIIIAEMNEATFKRAGASIEEFRAFLQERGYDAFALPQFGELPALIPRKTRIVTTRMNANVMFTTVAKVEKLWPEVLL